MSQKIKVNVPVSLFFMLLPGIVQAAFVDSAVLLDIESVSLTRQYGDLTLGFLDENSQVFVNADGNIGQSSGSKDAFANNSSPGGNAIASASSEQLITSTEVDSQGNTNAVAGYSIDYFAIGAGTVSVTVNYFLIFESIGTNHLDSSLFASASLVDTANTAFDEVSLTIGSGEDLSLIFPGQLEIILNLTNGDSGSLVFNAQSQAYLRDMNVSQVPLPPTLVLFGSALVGLSASRRMKVGKICG